MKDDGVGPEIEQRQIALGTVSDDFETRRWSISHAEFATLSNMVVVAVLTTPLRLLPWRYKWRLLTQLFWIGFALTTGAIWAFLVFKLYAAAIDELCELAKHLFGMVF